ncbi:uncharacterized protein LOC131652909 [Vicia villosa]|uniref:uncharacterized protein LOC131652909 n=1 Tax=Vicia villosa TaxID=3911 RepID=UPI00273B6E2D|nr:uncharacterized protein LOC131652909 [Vicia villosa]
MIIGSLNIRGGANALKRRRISHLINKGSADIFLLQETKISNMVEDYANSFWRHSEIGFSFVNSEGRSGGLITMWKKNTMDVLFSFKGEGYLGLKVCWKEDFYYVVNVYSSCDLSKKKVLWEKLLDLMRIYSDGEWILGGDFNAIKNARERKGRVEGSYKKETEIFAEFIHKSSLVDIPCKGKKFSWYSGDGKSMSRIDRF